MRSTLAFSLAAFAGLSAGQSTAQNNYPYTIDPNSVPESTRDVWCSNQQAQCPLICLQQPGVTDMTTTDNDCDPKALTYSCTCVNGVSPNITQYSQTLPFYICQQWGNNCVKACNGDNTCASACTQNHPCGAQHPYLGNTSIPTTMSSTRAPSASGTNKIPVTGFGGGSATATPTASSKPAGGAASASFMPSAALSMAAVMGSVFFGFAVLL